MSTKFKPGQSGNPSGRPVGKTPATMLRKALTEEMPTILATLIQSAKNGDVQAAKVLLDRVCPVLKPQALPILVPTGGTLAEQGGEIISSTLNGEIPPDIGSQLIGALSAQSKIVAVDELERRIEALENKP